MIDVQGLEELLQSYFDEECEVHGSIDGSGDTYTLNVPYTSRVDIFVGYIDEFEEYHVHSMIENFIELFDFEEDMSFSSLKELENWIESAENEL